MSNCTQGYSLLPFVFLWGYAFFQLTKQPLPNILAPTDKGTNKKHGLSVPCHVNGYLSTEQPAKTLNEHHFLEGIPDAGKMVKLREWQRVAKGCNVRTVSGQG
jgi:hypothetical protein